MMSGRSGDAALPRLGRERGEKPSPGPAGPATERRSPRTGLGGPLVVEMEGAALGPVPDTDRKALPTGEADWK